MISRTLQFCLLAGLLPLVVLGHGSAVRIKDITMISGARDNQLVGYGIVVGLAGDGDKNQPYTLQSLANLLQRFGVSVPASTLAAKNTAVVMITADIKAFSKEGTRLDVTVSSLGDAKTLQGGTLIQAPLRGIDGKVYALAQGAMSVGGFVGGNATASVQKNHPTVAVIPNGALVEKEIPTQLVQDHHVELLLRDPDFTTAARMAAAVNEVFPGSANALDPMTVRVQVPDGLETASVDFIARLERIEVTPDAPAKIIISERTGTIVATSRIQISACAVSHGDLTITIANSTDISQPNALSQTGQTTTAQRSDVKVVEKRATLINMPEMPTVEKVASGLNAIGVTPRDMMAIFEAMKEAHALQAELILR